MPTIDYSQNKVEIVCGPHIPLPELSVALEFCSNNFCGRGVYTWSVSRTKQESGAAFITAESLLKEQRDRPIIMSQVTQLGGAIEAGVIPRDAPQDQNLRFTLLEKYKQEKPLQDGQHRSRSLLTFANPDDGWTETIIESFDITPSVTLASLSFGFADMTVGLFALGVRNIKYLLTRARSQLYIKHKLPEASIIRYFQQQGTDYPLGMTVGKLP